MRLRIQEARYVTESVICDPNFEGQHFSRNFLENLPIFSENKKAEFSGHETAKKVIV